MIIQGTENQTVEINIEGYQFTDINDDRWDANWLNIHLNVNSSLGNWQATDAALTTWDVLSIVKWFTHIAHNMKPEAQYMEFTEPNLLFYLLSDYRNEIKNFRVEFGMEFRPKSAQLNDDNEDEYYVDFSLNNRALLKLASDLQAELDKFPIRV